MTQHLAVAERFLNAWTSGDTQAALRLCHPDLHFKGPIEEWSSAAQHLAALEGVARVVNRVEIKRAFADGEDVVIVYDLVTSTPVGNAQIAEWTTFRDEKISEIRAYFDSHPWRAAGFGG